MTTAVENIVRGLVRLQVTARTPGGGMLCMLCSSKPSRAAAFTTSTWGWSAQPPVPALARDLRTGRASNSHSELRAASRSAEPPPNVSVSLAKADRDCDCLNFLANLVRAREAFAVSKAKTQTAKAAARARRFLCQKIQRFSISLIPVAYPKHQRALGGYRAGQHVP